MADRAPKQGGEGLSLTTLVIAAAASGCAAVVTSYFWQRGTLISAALTPVIVTIVSEVLKRPATTVKHVAKKAVSTRDSVPLAHGAGAGPPDAGPTRELPAADPVPSSSASVSEIKVYRASGAPASAGGGRRFGKVHWKIVLATAGIAFVIAIAALTLPELLFGGSVGGSDNTTLFGGSSNQKTTTDQQKTSTEKTTTDQKTVTEQKTTTTTPTQTSTTPAQTTPTQTTPQQSVAPQQSSTPQATPNQATPPSAAPPTGTTP